MNRIDRLTGIIIFLQGRQRVTVEELAERYEISNRTVYRDLRALQEVGVPIGSEPGEGYFIVKGYHLPPVMFDKEEAAALLAGERLMQKWSETKLSESYLSALDKIRAVLHSREKEYLDTLDQHIKTFSYPDERQIETDPRVFVLLQDAIVNGEVMPWSITLPTRIKSRSAMWSRWDCCCTTIAGTWRPGAGCGPTTGCFASTALRSISVPWSGLLIPRRIR